MKILIKILITLLISVNLCFSESVDGDALKTLKDGNLRYSAENYTHPNLGIARMKNLSENGQKPYSIVVTCSDSRVAPELIFDCGIGDIFVIRDAGNVIGDYETASIDYAVSKLHTPVIVILGHTHCGAVHAVVEGAPVQGKLTELVQKIMPAVKIAKEEHKEFSGEEIMQFAVKQNVWQSMKDLIKSSKIVQDALKTNKLKLVGGIYDIANGNIDWLGELSDQAKIIKAESSKPDETMIHGTSGELPWWIFISIAVICGILGIFLGRMVFKDRIVKAS